MLINYLPTLQKVASFLTNKVAAMPVIRPRDPSLPKDIVSVRTETAKAVKSSKNTSPLLYTKHDRSSEEEPETKEINIDIEV